MTAALHHAGARGALCVPFLAAVALCFACASPPGAGGRDAVIAADRARALAMVAADREQLEATLHPSLTYTHSNGKLDTKASLIATLLEGDVDYRTIEPIDPHVRVRGDTAVLTTRVELSVEAAGRIHDLEMTVTAVYFLTDGRWQLAAYQSVRLED